MTNLDDYTIVIVPGLRDHVTDHWQTWLHLQCENSVLVPPEDGDKLNRARRVATLQSTINAQSGKVVLVAHSAGVLTTAFWAKAHPETATKIVCALLVTPADVQSPMPEGYPSQEALRDGGWIPIPNTPLPFPAWVAMSQNDPLGTVPNVSQMARDWGAHLIDVGAVGHLNPAAGYGPWDEAVPLLKRFLSTK